MSNSFLPPKQPSFIDEYYSTTYEDLIKHNYTTNFNTSNHTHTTSNPSSATSSSSMWGKTTITPNTLRNYSQTWKDPYHDCHNIHGPALMTKTDVFWYIDGQKIIKTKHYCKLANFNDITTVLWVLTYGDTLPAKPEEYRYLNIEFNNNP